MNRSEECADQASVSSSGAMRRWGRPRPDAILFIDLTKAIIRMQRERGSRIRRPNARTLDLPPPFRLAMLREVGDAFAHACAHAAELGAGTLFFVGRFALAESAFVLEPDEPLASARRAFYACMVALGDALAAMAPPEQPIVIEWPDKIYVDRRLVGGGRVGWPHHADERTPPDWLVFCAANSDMS